MTEKEKLQKEKHNKLVKKYYEEHKEELSEKRKKYYQKHKKETDKKHYEYVEKNRDRIKELSKIRYKNKKKEILEKHNEWAKKKGLKNYSDYLNFMAYYKKRNIKASITNKEQIEEYKNRKNIRNRK